VSDGHQDDYLLPAFRDVGDRPQAAAESTQKFPDLGRSQQDVIGSEEVTLVVGWRQRTWRGMDGTPEHALRVGELILMQRWKPANQVIFAPVDLWSIELTSTVAERRGRAGEGHGEAVKDEGDDGEVPGEYDQLDGAVIAEKFPGQAEGLVIDRSGAHPLGHNATRHFVLMALEAGDAPSLNRRDGLLSKAELTGHLRVREPLEAAVLVFRDGEDGQLEKPSGESGRPAEPGSELGDEDAEPRAAQEDVIGPDQVAGVIDGRGHTRLPGDSSPQLPLLIVQPVFR
jgi:hypothetical protein